MKGNQLLKEIFMKLNPPKKECVLYFRSIRNPWHRFLPDPELYRVCVMAHTRWLPHPFLGQRPQRFLDQFIDLGEKTLNKKPP